MKKIIAANWKMNETRAQGEALARSVAEGIASLPDDRKVVIFPPATALDIVTGASMGRFETGIQNFYPAENGAFTGEISPAMVHDCGGQWALCGHSERRHIFNEPDELISRKVNFALAHDLKVMLCVGETLEERESGHLNAVLMRQLTSALSGQSSETAVSSIAIAYEPVWAIGTGKTAGPAEIKEAHELIRGDLRTMFASACTELPILYGGSVKPSNAHEILGLDNVDGVLVGGASLEAKSFLAIINS
ncbi:MAG: triose-phosphate isomerase [Desulfovibrio sp.]|jgi:triosephosphate isomerase|nr:triose-phosphate isomerase [Desulfovibrio sp.]MDD7477819.1 triose-phosphate isomerase [Desulfovibrio sp.]